MKLVSVISEEFYNTSDKSVDLFKKYQMAIHNDPPEQCDRKSFFNFLIKSPLQVYFVFNLKNVTFLRISSNCSKKYIYVFIYIYIFYTKAQSW